MDKEEKGNMRVVDTPAKQDLKALGPEALIARINELEARLKTTTLKLAALTARKQDDDTESEPVGKTTTSVANQIKTRKKPKPFCFDRYSTRLIALKFAYLGHRYNGLEHTNGGLPPLKPTIEEALWKALRKARLIDPTVPDGCDGTFDVVFEEEERKKMYWDEDNGVKLEIDWVGKGLGYSKCGRTDKGVSAFGQVIGIRVRSNRPKETTADEQESTQGGSNGFDDFKDELPYLSILNSVLPSDIRIIAYCIDPDPSFDARFSCRERRYRYFFTNPAFCPTPGEIGLSYANGKRASVREGWLDIEAMQMAAKKLEGLHDYRNFCKIDASKQMSSCVRRITFTDVKEMSNEVDLHMLTTDPELNAYGTAPPADSTVLLEHPNSIVQRRPQVYAFCVHGTAFLWHQVRCMMGILFLVGQGLEKPEIVDQLLDIGQNPARPQYEMADDAPLVLWDCVFPGDEPGEEGGIKWTYAGDETTVSSLVRKSDSQFDGKFGIGGLVTHLWEEWREAKMKETLTAGLLSLALRQGDGTSLFRGGFRTPADVKIRSQRIFDGDNSGRTVGNYVQVMEKPKFATLEIQNSRYLEGKQTRRDIKHAKVSKEK